MLKWGNKIKFLVEPDFSRFLSMAETGSKEDFGLTVRCNTLSDWVGYSDKRMQPQFTKVSYQGFEQSC